MGYIWIRYGLYMDYKWIINICILYGLYMDYIYGLNTVDFISTGRTGTTRAKSLEHAGLVEEARRDFCADHWTIGRLDEEGMHPKC